MLWGDSMSPTAVMATTSLWDWIIPSEDHNSSRAARQWRRLPSTSWTIVPRAWESLLTYARLQIPPDNAFHRYDPLQQLTYAAVVFLVVPLMILTGLCMSPALIAHFPWYPTLF